MITKWLRGLKKGPDSLLARPNTPIAMMTNWDPLLQAVMVRVSQFEETDVCMIRFRNPKSKNSLSQHPTLVIGRLENLLASGNRPPDLFIHALGLIDPHSVPGSEEIAWLRAGFDVQRGKKGVTFGKGPLDISDFPTSLLSAFDVFTLFYGVTEESSVVTLGDPELEEALERTAGLYKVRAGRFLLI